MRIARPAVLIALAVARPALADGLITDDSFTVAPTAPLKVDAGLVAGFPAALPTGMTLGIGAGVDYSHCGLWMVGARASWTTATESSEAWTVTDSDLRLRATGAVQHLAGRGALALRLGLGGTVVHEARVRNQGQRAGLTGSDLASSAYAMLPAADLEAVVALHVAGPWIMVVSGGPSVVVHDGAAHGGWTSQLGVAWQP